MGVMLFCWGCSTDRKANLIPEPDPIWLNLWAEGDRQAEKRHYLGWLKAEQLYAQAWEIKVTPELRSRRVQNLGLLLLRKQLLQIPWKEGLPIYDGIKTATESPVMHCLSWLLNLNRLLTPLGEMTKEDFYFDKENQKDQDYSQLIDQPLIEIDQFADDVDLFIYHEYCMRRIYDLEELRRQKQELTELMKRTYPDSPLLILLNKDMISSFRPFFEQDEEFLEPRLFEAQLLLSQGKRSAAEKLYLEVLGLCADIPDVYRGLGLIYLAYENHAKAMEYFQQVLIRIRYDYESLFGMGASQLYTQFYEDSLATFSIIVDRKLPYQGEALYYKALNFYHLKRHEEALAQLNMVKDYVADLPDLWELEGIIHFYEDRLDTAQISFEKAISLSLQKRAFPAIPAFYLGLIATKAKNKTAAWNYFDQAAWFDLAEIERQVASLNSIVDGDEQKRQEKMIKKRIVQGLVDARERLKVSLPLTKGCPKQIREKLNRTEQQLIKLEDYWLLTK